MRSEVQCSYSSARPNESISDDGAALFGNFKFSPKKSHFYEDDDEEDERTPKQNDGKTSKSPRATRGVCTVKHAAQRLKTFQSWRNRDCCRDKILAAVKINPEKILQSCRAPAGTPKTPVKILAKKDVDLSGIDRVVSTARQLQEVPQQSCENHRRLFTNQVSKRPSTLCIDGPIIRGPFQIDRGHGEVQKKLNSANLTIQIEPNGKGGKQSSKIYDWKQFQYRGGTLPGVAGFMQYRKSSGPNISAPQYYRDGWNRVSQTSCRSPRQKGKAPVSGQHCGPPVNTHPMTASLLNRKTPFRTMKSSSQRASALTHYVTSSTPSKRKHSQLIPSTIRKEKKMLETDNRTWSVYETEGRASPGSFRNKTPGGRVRVSQTVTMELLDCPQTTRRADVASARAEDKHAMESGRGQYAEHDNEVQRTIKLDSKGNERPELDGVRLHSQNSSGKMLSSELGSRISTQNVTMGIRPHTGIDKHLDVEEIPELPIETVVSSTVMSSIISPGTNMQDRRSSANAYPYEYLPSKLVPVNQELQQARVRTPNNASSNRRVVIRKIQKGKSPSNHDIQDVFIPQSNSQSRSNARASTPIPAESRKQFDKLDNMIQAVERGEPHKSDSSEEEIQKQPDEVFAPIKMYSFITYQDNKPKPHLRGSKCVGSAKCNRSRCVTQLQSKSIIKESDQDFNSDIKTHIPIEISTHRTQPKSVMENFLQHPGTLGRNSGLQRVSQTIDIQDEDNSTPLAYQYGSLGSKHHSRQKTILMPMQRLQCEEPIRPRLNKRQNKSTENNSLRKASARDPSQLSKINKTLGRFADIWGRTAQTQ